MDIGKSNNNFKDRKPKCFNATIWTHGKGMPNTEKKEQETRICFKCNKKGHIAKNCKGKEMMKKRKLQEESDDEDKKEEKGFGEDLE